MMKKLVMLSVAFALFMGSGAFADDMQRGWDAYGESDYATALQEWQPLAEKGNAKAQFALGLLYEYGYGVPQDHAEALKLYKLSAEQGEAQAQYALGDTYSKGQGVPQNYKEATKWYRLAAEQVDAVAQFRLGEMYHYGQGVPEDYVLAHMWYNLAISNHTHPEMIDYMTEFKDLVTDRMTRSEIEKAHDFARECVAKNYKGC